MEKSKDYRRALEEVVFKNTKYEVQMQDPKTKIWALVCLVLGRPEAYKEMEVLKSVSIGKYRVIRQDQADHYREGLSARKKRSRKKTSRTIIKPR